MLVTQVNGHGQHSLLMFKPFNFELTGRQKDIAKYAARTWATAVKDQILVSLEQETDTLIRIGLQNIGKMLLELSLNICCNICTVGSEFGINIVTSNLSIAADHEL